MLGIRILFALVGILLLINLLGWFISRDARWLRAAKLTIQGGFALIGLLLLALFVQRLVMGI
jgi:hypothetical protein